MTELQDRQRTILLVEDDALIAMAEVRALQTHGFLVLTVPSGERAIEAVKNNEHIHLILMDINLGAGMDGVQAAAMIIEDHDIPVIFLSSHTEEDIAAKTEKITSYGYVVKDSGMAVLVASVKTAFRLHEAHRKLIEKDKALRDSELKAVALINAVEESVWLFAPDGTVLAANTTAAARLGTGIDELVGNKALSLVPPHIIVSRQRSIAEVIRTGVLTRLEDERDGTVFEHSFYPVRDSGGNITAVASFSRDITERKKMEKDLKESEERYRSIFESNLDGVLLTQPDGSILSANRRACEMLRMTEEEIIRAGRAGVVVDDERLRAAIAERAKTGKWRGELTVRRMDGSTFSAGVSSNVFTAADGTTRTAMVIHDVTERKQTEQVLAESKARLDLALQSASMGVWHWDLIEDRRTFDDQVCRLLGIEPATFTGGADEFFDVVHPEDREMLKAALTGTIERNAPYEPEYRVVWPDGSVRHIAARGRLVRDDTNRPERINGIIWDVTDRKDAEEVLRWKTAFLEALLDASPDGILVVDGQGKIILQNQRTVDLWKIPQEIADCKDDEAQARHVLGVVKDPDEFNQQVLHLYAHPSDRIRDEVELLNGTVLDRYSSLVGKDGTYYGRIFGFHDITDRKRAEDALRESEAKLRAILDASRDAIGVSQKGIHTFANPAYLSLFGYESDNELIGTPIIDLIAPESRGFVEETVKKRALGEPVPSFYEATGLKRDGTTFLVEANISTYVLNDQQFSLVVMRDITEKKRLEDQLRQAQKMEAVGTLAGGVAHDFNNILTVIMGLGNLMQMSIDKDDIHKAYVDQIVASSERAADLTQSLLAFSRKQRIAPEAHTVNGIVTSTAKLLARLLPEDIGLKMDLTNKNTSSLLDVTQIGQVLMNLATNARDAMPHGGSLTITTQQAKMDEDFTKTHGFGRAGEYVKLSVSDTGAGMDSETMKRIFEPFFTTKEVGKGTGLGLASAYGIVKQHGGYITVSSTPFQGTTFDIYLPLLKTPSRQRSRVKGDVRGGTETILIVEDDRDVRNMLTKILESQGYTTLEAVDGDDAIEVYNVHKEKVDLVILDVVMPGKNGKEVLDEITRTNPFVKAVFVSGYTGDVVLDKGIQNENVDFLQKPLTVQGLLAKVREVLDR